MSQSLSFITEKGITIPTISAKQHEIVISRMLEQYEFSNTHLSEATALSMAMVVRYSLGSYAKDGFILGIISDSTAGLVATAALRHLMNGGAKAALVLPTGPISATLDKEIKLALAAGVTAVKLDEAFDYLSGCHCLVLGIFGGKTSALPLKDFASIVNDLTLPVHAVVYPDERSSQQKPLFYSASTLSLGIPLVETATHHDSIGRHYLCDICIPHEIYRELGLQECAIFSEQPIIKLQIAITQ